MHLLAEPHTARRASSVTALKKTQEIRLVKRSALFSFSECRLPLNNARFIPSLQRKQGPEKKKERRNNRARGFFLERNRARPFTLACHLFARTKITPTNLARAVLRAEQKNKRVCPAASSFCLLAQQSHDNSSLESEKRQRAPLHHSLGLLHISLVVCFETGASPSFERVSKHWGVLRVEEIMIGRVKLSPGALRRAPA